MRKKNGEKKQTKKIFFHMNKEFDKQSSTFYNINIMWFFLFFQN